ncbi:hypothetical protein BPS26883_04758 [Burkholderia pseudomultivorans]|uniref:Pentapeptide repeat-containing protein n=1 Tax=Burkholderia pseudomultivorans TaxID=1207504 RepID=A0A6P2NTG9_9BURK|nr:pentapeptide repeat-containing protein [Burkholderia pseudomultivorans]VWB98350.1 hypothetical protein BPS26883_04758 [Burkholderia pseudomultivorans]
MPNSNEPARDSASNGANSQQMHAETMETSGPDDIEIAPTKPESSAPASVAEIIRALSSTSRKKYEGGKFPQRVVAVSFMFHDFTNIDAKGVVFEGCNFKFCIFNGAYFRKSKFKNCDFTGAKFKDCNFRDSILSGSKFDYCQFSNTLISTKELLLNSPTWLNVRREFMMSLRKNAESVGDIESAKIFIREELKAARKYCQEGWRHQGSYYKEKYPNLSDRINLFSKALGYGLDWHFWGHGEYPSKLVRFILITLFISGGITLALDDRISLSATPVSTFISTYGQSTIAATCTFLGVTPDHGLPIVPEPLRIVLAFSRYIALGFFTSSLFRRLSRR